ncbi:MAG TPA: B3/4 domain-containing protein [Solirubrobacterales bacterium]|nr:B3/4 domain-containing protein [Solirubrobacterales bacterium]
MQFGQGAERGWVAPHVAEEFPGLGVSWTVVDGGRRRSPEAVRLRLRDLSDRFYGSHAIHMRERPIPWAYRVFFRHIGLDPDETRTPVERLALDRLYDGAFVSHGLPDDAVTLATVETGVAMRAFDADKIEGGLCIRGTAPGESLPDRQSELPQGTLAIADERRPLEPLFGGPPSEEHGVDPATRRVLFAAIQVKDVPEMAVNEALWLASSALVE